MWKIRYIENGIRYETGIYSMSETGAIESFEKCYPNGKLLSIYFDSNVSE